MLLQEDVKNINQCNRACWSGLGAPVSVLTHFVGGRTNRGFNNGSVAEVKRRDREVTAVV